MHEMNILIITTFFPPDTSIASVRPYMFAKHLAAMGENVTVLRTGYFNMKPFDDYKEDGSFEVLSALGRNCPAEKFRRGEYEGFQPPAAGRFGSLPGVIRVSGKAVRDGANVLRGIPPKYFKRSCTVLKYQKRMIDRLHDMNRKYDVVFSTCGELENIYAGKYAAERFGAKWIMDFRDSMIFKGKGTSDIWRNIYGKDATICAIENADIITAVSEGLKDEICAVRPSSKLRVLYNGFDDGEDIPDICPDKDTFSFCYTGRLYEYSLPALKAFADSLSKLIREGKLERGRVKYHYAGSSSEDFKAVFSKAGIEDIVVEHGYLSKAETLELQLSSDVFTVLAWNTRSSKGMLTGKFYEGIKARKPILTLISGNEPDSELLKLQNKYDYGFCFEQAGRNTMTHALEEHITKLYDEKMSAGAIEYRPSQELYDAFSYTTLSRRLHDIMLDITGNGSSNTFTEE